MLTRYVNVACRYISDRTGINVCYELRLRVTGQTNEQIAEAAIQDSDVRVAALARELNDHFRPLDDTEGVFVEVNDA
ncbi:MAG: hypothetical protein IPK59_03940 [Rhodospirillaceae bacterium]|nr:hypothetical protein [Rhodospirillaceae bacterium]